MNLPHPRLGSCGSLIDVPVGSVLAPKGSIAVTRNYDYDFVSGNSQEQPYRLSKPVRPELLSPERLKVTAASQVMADPVLHDAVRFPFSTSLGGPDQG